MHSLKDLNEEYKNPLPDQDDREKIVEYYTKLYRLTKEYAEDESRRTRVSYLTYLNLAQFDAMLQSIS